MSRKRSEETKRKDSERARLWRLNNPERNAANRRKWRAANPEKKAAADKRYALAHPEKVKERWQRHQKLHPEKCAERAKRYRDKNRDKVNAYLRSYFQTEGGKVARRNGEHKRRCRINETNTITAKQLEEFLASGVQCHYCSATLDENIKPTVDHKVPLAKGGKHSLDNLVVACLSCNSSKGVKDYEMYMNSIKRAA